MFRFAPSLSENMHIETLRVALFNYISAKQKNDKFIVRIEDIDTNCKDEERYKGIIDILNIFGINYDSLYYQSNNFKYHLQFASTLLDKKKAFMCFCTKEEIEKKRQKAKDENRLYCYDGKCEDISSQEILESRKPFVIRVKKPKNSISFKDKVKGCLTFEADKIDSFIIMEVDKYPTYNFACSIDDMLQGVTSIIRGEKYLTDTPKQEYIRELLGYNQKIDYTHLPPILNINDKHSVEWLLNQGYIPEAIINYLILTGNKTPKEIFTINEAIEWFDPDNISKSPVKFDINRLKYINKKHINLLNDAELAKRLGYSGKSIGKLAKFFTKEADTTLEIKKKIDKIFSLKSTGKEFEENLKILKKVVQNAPKFQEFENFIQYLTKESGIKENLLSKTLMILLTGSEEKTELKELYPFIKDYLKEIAR